MVTFVTPALATHTKDVVQDSNTLLETSMFSHTGTFITSGQQYVLLLKDQET